MCWVVLLTSALVGTKGDVNCVRTSASGLYSHCVRGRTNRSSWDPCGNWGRKQRFSGSGSDRDIKLPCVSVAGRYSVSMYLLSSRDTPSRSVSSRTSLGSLTLEGSKRSKKSAWVTASCFAGFTAGLARAPADFAGLAAGLPDLSFLPSKIRAKCH